MAEVGIAIVAEIVRKLVDAVIDKARYSFCFNRHIKELQKEKENLQSKVESVIDRVTESAKKTEKVVNDVEKWLYKADCLIARVIELEENAIKRKKTPCFLHCPNFIRHYSFAKQLEEKSTEIRRHCEVEFLQFSRLTTLVGMNYFSSQDFLHFDCRQRAYDELLKALRDDKVHMIGLHGMGGCGKTTLAKQVGEEAEQFFDKVVFIVVSNVIDAKKIQRQIAGQLSLELKEEEESDRARRVFMRLRSGKRILIILDDVWEMLDFKAIGIPDAENQPRCTTLITTRKFDVCRMMKCKQTISLNGLDENEAWTLFQKHAGTFDDNSNTLKGLAQQITKQCDGLPIAIAAVANTLKGRTQIEWVEALETLRDSSWVEIEDNLTNTYACLRLSYDNLKDEVAKSLFLLCAVCPQNYEIAVDQLVMYGIGLGLVEAYSYERARNQVIRAKRKLVDCCLLLEVSGATSIKMHDLVRDVALWIAKKQIKLITGQERDQNAFQEDVIMRQTVRYLWINKMDKLSHKVECPELEFLFISVKFETPIDVTNDFFEGMKKLKVLVLENENNFDKQLILQWSKLLSVVNNLRCLLLNKWLLGDISFIQSLERLESLKLWCCCFYRLPECIIEQNLKSLDIERCEILVNPYKVIGRCAQLKELYFCHNYGKNWEDQAKSCAEFFDKNTIAPALESYCIDLGESCGDFYRQKLPITRSLYVEDFETCISNATIKDLMQRAEVLSLGRIHESCKNIIPDVFQTIGGGMHALTQLSLCFSEKIECVIDIANHLSQVGIISRLTHLTIKEITNLKTLCHGQPPPGLFANLEVLDICGCQSLENIIADDVSEIVVADNEYHMTFPKLKTMIIYQCKQLEYLMPITSAQSLTQLEVLDIRRANKLKSVFGKSIHEDPSSKNFQMIEFSALSYLSLNNLPNIISICPNNYHSAWPSLKSLNLGACPQLDLRSINYWIARSDLGQKDYETSEELHKAAVTPLETLQSLLVQNTAIEVIFDGEGFSDTEQQVNSSLQYLRLHELPELRHIWRGPTKFLLLRNLGKLIIQECRNLRVIFPASVSRSLQQLKELDIRKCKELKEIIEEESPSSSDPHQLVFPNLIAIFIRHCHKLKQLFPISPCHALPKLRILFIHETSEVEKVFGDEQGEPREIRTENLIPNLEYVILWQLPKLTTGGQWIDLRAVRYLLVQQCSGLNITSTITPQRLLQILDNEKAAYWDDRWELQFALEDIVESNEDFSREVESLSTSNAQNNEQELTPITSPKSTENVKEQGDQNAQEQNIVEETNVQGRIKSSNVKKVTSSAHSEATSPLVGSFTLPFAVQHSVQGRVEEGATSKDVQIITTIAHLELSSSTKSINGVMPSLEIYEVVPTSSLHPVLISEQPTSNPVDISQHKTPNETSVKNSDYQRAQKENLSRENDAKGSFECSPSSESDERFASATHSKSASSQPGTTVTSTTTLPHNKKESEDSGAHKRDMSEEKSEGVRAEEYTSSKNVKIVTTLAHLESTSSMKAIRDLEIQSAQMEIISRENDVKGSFEGSLSSKNSKMITPSTLSHIQTQIKFSPSNSDVEDMKEDDLISVLEAMEDEHVSKSPILSDPTIANAKDELVAKALADLEGSLKMPLKDIATSEANSLRLLAALNFLSHPSLEDRALSHEAMATIKYIHKDFPDILSSFKQAYATANKFAVPEERDKSIKYELSQRKEVAIALVSKASEAQEKETRLKEQILRLEKEKKYYEAELLSLQEQKRKYIAETMEFKKEIETVRKEKSEMLEDQRNAQQQLFQADHKWSVLGSQFERNIADRNLS